RASERVFLLLSGGHDALGWLDERMRGRPLPAQPDVRTVLSTFLAPRALIMYVRQIVAIVKLLAGKL
ncbi:triacylglycerol lipase, partial [Mycolicibacter hiberniae]|nr:triacylglycerol lipase [Mycolicibacter hiberniae]